MRKKGDESKFEELEKPLKVQAIIDKLIEHFDLLSNLKKNLKGFPIPSYLLYT